MKEKITWTQGMVAKLKKCVSDKVTYAQIGADMGMSRSAVAGKVSRMRIGEGSRHMKTKPAMKKIKYLDHDIEMRRVKMLELSRNQCSWVDSFSPGDGTICCGNNVSEKNAAYCSAHAAIVYVKQEDKKDV